MTQGAVMAAVATAALSIWYNLPIPREAAGEPAAGGYSSNLTYSSRDILLTNMFQEVHTALKWVGEMPDVEDGGLVRYDGGVRDALPPSFSEDVDTCEEHITRVSRTTHSRAYLDAMRAVWTSTRAARETLAKKYVGSRIPFADWLIGDRANYDKARSAAELELRRKIAAHDDSREFANGVVASLKANQMTNEGDLGLDARITSAIDRHYRNMVAAGGHLSGLDPPPATETATLGREDIEAIMGARTVDRALFDAPGSSSLTNQKCRLIAETFAGAVAAMTQAKTGRPEYTSELILEDERFMNAIIRALTDAFRSTPPAATSELIYDVVDRIRTKGGLVIAKPISDVMLNCVLYNGACGPQRDERLTYAASISLMDAMPIKWAMSVMTMLAAAGFFSAKPLRMMRRWFGGSRAAGVNRKPSRGSRAAGVKQEHIGNSPAVEVAREHGRGSHAVEVAQVPERGSHAVGVNRKPRRGSQPPIIPRRPNRLPGTPGSLESLREFEYIVFNPDTDAQLVLAGRVDLHPTIKPHYRAGMSGGEILDLIRQSAPPVGASGRGGEFFTDTDVMTNLSNFETYVSSLTRVTDKEKAAAIKTYETIGVSANVQFAFVVIRLMSKGARATTLDLARDRLDKYIDASALEDTVLKQLLGKDECVSIEAACKILKLNPK